MDQTKHSGVTVFVRGGIVQGAMFSDGTPCFVDVHDYDVENCTEDELQEMPIDSEGKKYASLIA